MTVRPSKPVWARRPGPAASSRTGSRTFLVRMGGSLPGLPCDDSRVDLGGQRLPGLLDGGQGAPAVRRAAVHAVPYAGGALLVVERLLIAGIVGDGFAAGIQCRASFRSAWARYSTASTCFARADA